ncbi:MAG: DNA polymerase III subunit [Pirellulaceae bacterium]|nr:DNA polymerase III subunit [Pirellulaceae bacterium]
MLRGHAPILDQFRHALSRGRLASTFLFVGPAGIGKRLLALHLAQALLCERRPEERLDPCGECPSCRQVLAGSHPDVEIVGKPADKAFIPVESLIGDKEHRMRAGLCYNISNKPFSGRRKIAIIDDADYLNKEGANCLLKTLEEPPPKSILILIGTSEQRQLPTIRSRCQIVRFAPLAADDVAAILVEQGLCPDPAAAQKAARQGHGSIERASLWCDERLVEFRVALLAILSDREPSLAEASKLVGSFVDEAGKEAPLKRARLRLVFSLAEEFYRQLLVAAAAGQKSGDPALDEAATRALRWFPGEEGAAACLDLCLDAYAHLEANANQATLIEWWLDELASAARMGRVSVG